MVSSDYNSFGTYVYGSSSRANPNRFPIDDDSYLTKPSTTTTLSQPKAAVAASSAPAAFSISSADSEQEDSKGGIGNFFKGILNGAKGLGEFLTNPKNWPLILGTLVLCSFFPMVGVGLAAVGLALGGIKFGKGVSSGNMEQAGEGVFDMGIWAAGGASSWKAAKSAKSAATTAQSTQVASSGSGVSGILKQAPSHAWNTVSSGSTAQSLTDWFKIG
jgi:hypothetical protein